MKVYSKRDSATAALRKLGIKPGDYNLFIKKVGGEFHCNVSRALAHKAELDEAAKYPVVHVVEGVKIRETLPIKGKIKIVSRSNDVMPRPISVAAFARELILAGRTNEDVFKSLQAKFNLDKSKKHYPSWYRCQLRAKGLLK